MKLACNIRWRLRLELQQLHGPRKQMSNWMSEYCFAFEGAEIMWGGECVRVVEKRQQDPGQLLCVSQNACQWRIFLAWDMQTWTKNEFTIQKAENRRSGYFQILWAAVCFFSYEFVGSVPVALWAIFMHLSWLLRAFSFAQKTIQFVSKLCRQEMEKWLAFLNGNRNDKVH